MESLEGLREEATEVLQSIRTKAASDSKPLFVEFSGTPKSGKSTCIDIVSHFFRRLDYKVLAPTEGASKRTPYYLKDDWVAFNTWSASYALMHVLDGLHGSDRYDLAILDRGLFDALAWFELLQTQGRVTPQERDHVHNFLLVDHWCSAIDAVLLFKADHETSLERENSDKLINEPGRAMNAENLQQLNNAYDEVKRKYAQEFPRFETIDTSKNKATTPRSTAEQAARLILAILKSRQE